MPPDLIDYSQSSFKSVLRRQELYSLHMPFSFFVKVDQTEWEG